jgi:putative hydrolase of the HAD superfamily
MAAVSRWRALTLDLDDTLWPVGPTIERAELALHAWLAEHAPATAARFDRAGLRALREQVGAEQPARGHDLSWLRRASIARALETAGDDPALARPAFDVFFDQRQRVTLYPEVPGALSALGRRLPLLALTNGNADLARIGLHAHFAGVLSASDFGIGKPHARFFLEGCRRLGCAPAEVLHVGDDWRLDVEGAAAAGMGSVWLRRPGQPDRPAHAAGAPWRVLSSLDQLVEALDLPAGRP